MGNPPTSPTQPYRGMFPPDPYPPLTQNSHVIAPTYHWPLGYKLCSVVYQGELD